MQRVCRLLLFSFVVLLGSSTLADAQKKRGKVKSLASMPALQSWTLANGLEVAFLPMPKAPSVTVQLWYHVGSKNEAPNKKGSAHMFEHMMFKGSQHVREQEHAQFLNALGGSVNAFTTEDATAYHNTLPPEYLDFALQLEAERMENLWFREDMIKVEKEVVKEEIRQQENSPLYQGFLQFLRLAYRVHPYAWTASGDLKDLEATSTTDLQAFYKQYYVPSNALLVVVGNAKGPVVKASVQKWFGGMAKTKLKKEEPPLMALSKKVEPKQQEKRREVASPAQIGVVMRGYHIPAAKHPDIYALRVLALVLSGGESSRLYEKLVRKDKIAVQAGGQLLVHEDPGLFMVFGAFLKAEDAPKLERALRAQIVKLQKSLVRSNELRQAKNQLIAQFAYGLESVKGIANQIGTSWIERGNAKDFMQDLEAFEKVSSSDIKRVAQTYFQETQASIVVIPPTIKPATTKVGAQ